MNEIRLKKWIGLDEVLNWDYSETEEVKFIVIRESRFKLLAEGTFIAAIQALRRRTKKLSVHFTFEVTPLLAKPTNTALPDFLNTLGGLALIQCADLITDSKGADITLELIDALWEKYLLPKEGVIGDGKKQSLVSRFPGAPVPKCLRQKIQVKIPARLQFEQFLRKLGKRLGAVAANSNASFLDSVTEDELSGFLFEAFRNVIEHNTVGIVPGVWGIVVEKVLITIREEISERGQIPELLRDYLKHAIEKKGSKRDTFVLAVTVADYGKGIQHTLPRKEGTEEDSWECLMRAFQRGVSRKPKSGSPDWGQGLPNILETIGHLKALLFLRSAEEAAIVDGKTGAPSWKRVTDKGTACKDVAGTSLTIMWIVSGDDPDQATFKFD